MPNYERSKVIGAIIGLDYDTGTVIHNFKCTDVEEEVRHAHPRGFNGLSLKQFSRAVHDAIARLKAKS